MNLKIISIIFVVLLLFISSFKPGDKGIFDFLESVNKFPISVDPSISPESAKLMYKLENDKLDLTPTQINSEKIIFDYRNQDLHIKKDVLKRLLDRIKSIDSLGYFYVYFEMQKNQSTYNNFSITLTGLGRDKKPIKINPLFIGRFNSSLSSKNNYLDVINKLNQTEMSYFYKPSNNLGGVVFDLNGYIKWINNYKCIYIYPVLETNLGNPFLSVVFSNVTNLDNVVSKSENLVEDASFADRGQSCCQ